MMLSLSVNQESRRGIFLSELKMTGGFAGKDEYLFTSIPPIVHYPNYMK